MGRSIAALHSARLAVSVGIWLIAIAVDEPPAKAQDGVTCGITVGPDGNMINLGPCRNTPGHADLYGAVAISPSTHDRAASHGQNSQSAAERQALQLCGRKDCEIVYWVRNSCAALAVSYRLPGPYGAAMASDRAEAASKALAQCTSRGGQRCSVQLTPCAGDDARWSSPLPLPPGDHPGSVDPKLVGTWKHLVNPGYWVLQIGPDGSFAFHSEALDGAAPTMGTFSASNGVWTMHATNLAWDDKGTYRYVTSGEFEMTGRLGPGTWQRFSTNPHQ